MEKKKFVLKKSTILMVLCIILAVALVAAIITKGFTSFSGTISGQAIAPLSISADEAGKRTVTFINDNLLQAGTTAEFKSASEKNGLYAINLTINGQELQIFVSKDAELLFGTVPIDMSIPIPKAEIPTAEVPKADKTSAELYIFSYCPAGTAALDSFAKAGLLLSGMSNLKVKFFSNMHGIHEKQQNMIQECIQVVDKNKYWAYASQYVSKIYNVCGGSRSVDCDKNESIKLMNSVGIDSAAVMTCVVENGESIYAKERADADTLQLQYSPSIIINGVYIENADRSPEGLKKLICNGFNTIPKECNQTLSGSTAASSGSCS